MSHFNGICQKSMIEKKNIIYYLLTQSVKDKYLTEKFLTRLL